MTWFIDKDKNISVKKFLESLNPSAYVEISYYVRGEAQYILRDCHERKYMQKRNFTVEDTRISPKAPENYVIRFF